MELNINNAITLLRHNGYIVKKITPLMNKDADECEELGFSKECINCSCNMCIME
jgi:hypothetical protein